MEIGSSSGGGGLPCGACKFMRRRCKADCIFASSFASEYSSEQFAVMHRVFGASNLSKLLSRVPLHLRRDAVTTLLYEAKARIKDPVYGCTAHIFALQIQVQLLQEEIMQVKAQLSKEAAVSRALQSQSCMLRSFSDRSLQSPRNKIETPPLDFQDHYNSSTRASVVSGSSEEYNDMGLGMTFSRDDADDGDYLRREICSQSHQPIGIHHSSPATYLPDYSTALDHHHDHQLFFPQMGLCDHRVGAVQYLPAAQAVLAEDDFSFN